MLIFVSHYKSKSNRVIWFLEVDLFTTCVFVCLYVSTPQAINDHSGKIDCILQCQKQASETGWPFF